MIDAITGLPNRLTHFREDVIIDGSLTVNGVITTNASAASAYSSGTAGSYALLTPSALTVTTPQIVSGDVGEGTLTGVIVFASGSNHNPAPAQPLADAASLYAQLTALTPTYSFTGVSVALDTVNVGNGAGVFTPGIYNAITTGEYGTTTAGGTITLSGAGDYVFVFATAGAYITFGAGTNISLVNGATAARVFWVISGALTTGANTAFKGTSISQAAATTGAGAHVMGKLISLTAAITIGAGSTIIEA